MKDLTRGSIVSHILSMAPPIVVGMITIMICQLVDLYFVSGLGAAAVAGVAAAGNAGFLVNALMQMLGVGTVALIAHAVGRKDRDDANFVFNQSVVLSALSGLSTVKSLDRILVFDRGEIVEQGTHAMLAARPGGIYRSLFERQVVELGHIAAAE